MSLFQAYRNDEKEIKGTWVGYRGGVELFMRRAGGLNASYGKVLRRKMEPHQRQLLNGDVKIPEDVANRVLAEAFAEAIVLDWRTKQDDGSYVPTVEFPEGNDLPFSQENVVKVFLALPDFFDRVRVDAGDRAQFIADAKEADRKN